MRSLTRRGLLLGSFFALSGCASKFVTYNGPEVTRLIVLKEKRVMYALHGTKVLERYDVELGFGSRIDKQVEGDGGTPVGRYFIDRRNPNSSFYLSLGISYPNARDIARANALGKSPGGDIFIHGQPNIGGKRGPDWTAGCIAVTNKEMRQLYAMVKTGTVIDIYP